MIFKNKKTTMMNLKIEVEQKELAERRAAKEGLSLSAYIRRLIIKDVLNDENE